MYFLSFLFISFLMQECVSFTTLSNTNSIRTKYDSIIYPNNRMTLSQSLIMRSKKSTLHNTWSNNGHISTSSLGAKIINQKAISPTYKPRTHTQATYVKSLASQSTSIVVGVGPAGCGKTLFACLQGIQMLKNGTVKKLILTRPIVSVEDEEIGFLPGNLAKKMDPWTRPILDTLLEFYHQKDLDDMFYNGVIEICTLAFMRGRTFKHAFIIADEMQNSTPNQMFMLTTRVGDNCKMVITGDLKQTDRVSENGLSDFIQKHNSFIHSSHHNEQEKELISFIHMNATDVQRSSVVSHILNIYNKSQIHSKQFNPYDNDNSYMDSALIPKKDLSKRYPTK